MASVLALMVKHTICRHRVRPDSKEMSLSHRPLARYGQ